MNGESKKKEKEGSSRGKSTNARAFVNALFLTWENPNFGCERHARSRAARLCGGAAGRACRVVRGISSEQT